MSTPPYRLPALKNVDWSEVLRAIEEHRRFALVTHICPDTDGVGSQIALHRHLARIGKTSRIINPEPLAERLAFLDPDGTVEAYGPEHDAFLESAALIVLDVSERDRLGPIAPLAARNRATTICIDHHVNQDRRFAAIDVIEIEAPSTGVLACELLQEMGAEFDPVIAQAIYATIVADTGSFRFSNTTSDVMRLAADLIDLGANPQQVHRAVLGTYSPAKLRLLAVAVAGSSLECDGQLSWFAISRPERRRCAATVADADGLVEYLRLLGGVRTALLFVETDQQDEVKVSLRSEPGVDVNRLASRWGGGGHRHASGAILRGPIDEVVKRAVVEARRMLFPAAS